MKTKYYRYLQNKQKKNMHQEVEIKYRFLSGVNSIYLLINAIVDILVNSVLFIIDLIFSIVLNKNNTKEYFHNLKYATSTIYYILTRKLKDIVLSIVFSVLSLILLPMLVNFTSTYLDIDTHEKKLQNQLEKIIFATSDFYNFDQINNDKSFTILFDNAKSTVDKSYVNNAKEFEEIVDFIEDKSKYIITIQGQASATVVKEDNSNYKNNYELSYARAINTKETIIKELANKQVNIRFILSATAAEGNSWKDADRKATIKIYKWEDIKMGLGDEKSDTTFAKHMSELLKNIQKKFTQLIEDIEDD